MRVGSVQGNRDAGRRHVVIRTPDQRLRVFVSSTLGELAEERRAVQRAIAALRLTPVLFEAGARPHPPRELYRAYLAQSDIFVGLYWQRYGQVNPGMDVSGLEEELRLAAGLPRLLYVKVPAPQREPRLAELLARVRDETSYRRFGTPAELGRLVRDDLAALLSERFVSGGQPASRRAAGPRPLPVGATSLFGRERAIDEVAELLGRPEVRLVTLTGPGGIGKTRLAVAVAERLRGRFGAGSAFVPLAGVDRPELVLASIARALGADLGGTGAPLEVLVELFGDDPWLLLLDNLEQVVDAAQDLGELLTRCPGVVLLATTRTVLGLRAEREYPVPPLPMPADPAEVSLEELAASPAVALFVERARAVRHDFALTAGNAAAVVEICRRLEGLPLAIELAAARTRLLDPEALLPRLSRSLDALGTGAVDLPERQRTLRATVDWSFQLLEEDERSLLETVAVFVDGWTIQAAARVAGVGEERALELCEALARHSLVQSDSNDHGPRLRMLETIREFVAERLAARPDVAGIGRRHADHFRSLAEQADRPLRGIGQNEWAQRLEADAGNLAAAVRWYLANDPRPAPHLFRILVLFWSLQDHMSDARPWIDQLLPAAGSLGHQARAEVLWTAALNATDVGDDATARSARERLVPLLAGLGDPYLHAVCRFAIAGLSALLGDIPGALRVASASLEEFRGQDEPFWTALAAFTVGTMETGLGHFDDALRHLLEVRDLAERLDNALLAAWFRVQLGTLEVLRGRLAEAHALLSEGMERSLGMRNTRTLTMSLAAFGRLAFEDGDAERAALLVGAAEGLRRRVGLRAWPMLRRGGADLGTEIREALGRDRFDQAFAAGTRLTQREAVAAVRGVSSSAEAQSTLRGPRRRVM
jgi:predicted ATPase